MSKNTIKGVIRPFADQAICTLKTQLGTAACLVRTSYEPIFVFDAMLPNGDAKKFLGIISLYDALYLRGLTATTIVSHACFLPARLTRVSNIYDAAAEMVSRRLNTLPVFNDDKKTIAGIVTARDLVTASFSLPVFERALPFLHPEHAVGISQKSFLKEAHHALRDRDVSEVIVLDRSGSIVGIASRGDVIRARIKPNPRQRFTSHGNAAQSAKEAFYDVDTVTRDYYPLKRYYHPVTSITRESKSSSNFNHSIRELIQTPYTSLVIIDKEARPQEILSYQHILEAFVRSAPKHNIPILVHDQRERFSAIEKDRMIEVAERFYRAYDRRQPIHRISVSFEESLTKSETIRAIGVVLKVDLKSGRAFVTKARARDALTAFRSSLRGMRSEISHLHKKIQNHTRDTE